ncbi:MAG: LysR family transcriptional regulator [Gaiellales bacterium]
MPIYPTAQLEAFVEVAAQAGFTRAAERLGVSQPTVSQLVRSLEARLGTPLFVRGPRRVELTAAGRALLPHAERALELAAEAEAAVNRAAAAQRARLWVGAGEALATYVLPPAVARLRRRLPRREAGFVVGDVARVLSALRSGEVDAALVTEHTAPPDLELVPFGSTRTVLITSSGESAATRPMRLAELAERVLVVRDPGTVNRREIDQLLAEAGVEPAGRLEASSLEAVKRCVEAGLGVAIVPGIAVRRELEFGTLRERLLRPAPPPIRLCIAWRRGEAPLPAVRALRGVLEGMVLEDRELGLKAGAVAADG